jgi:GT2 family glycosyltransferase
MSEAMQNITIVIPNWNGLPLLRKYLKYVLLAAGSSEILVVDDNSSDGSVSYIKEHFSGIRIIQRPHQGGFSEAANEGVLKAKGDIVVLLNTDVCPTKHFLDAILPHFQDRTVFAVGCLDKSVEKKGTILRGRGLGWWEKGMFVHAKGNIKSDTTAWVSGGSGAFRKDIWLKLGGLDSLYAPFYWEDIDLSYRARKAGYAVKFEKESVIFHYHEAGVIKKHFQTQDIRDISYRNQFLFIWKNADTETLLSHILFLPYHIIAPVARNDFSMARGLWSAFRILPKILRKRASVQNFWMRKDKELNIRT